MNSGDAAHGGDPPPRQPRRAAPRPQLPPGVLKQNDTSFATRATVKLHALYEEFLKAREAAAEAEAAGPRAPGGVARWAGLLKYYQYLVRAVMVDPEFGVGAPGNARGLLVYHLMGMGKTRLAAAVAMSLWDARPVVLMLPRSLQANFAATVGQVVGLLNAGAPPAELARLRAAAAQKFAFVSMDAYNAADQVARGGRGRGGAPAGGLDGKLLIVDEAHNFFRAIINSSAENSNARRIYNMVMEARDLRLLFLTGTPAAKDPFELVPCFNMLAGRDLLPVQYEIFYRLYVDREARGVRNPERLANRLVGLVSHVSPLRPSEPAAAGGRPPAAARGDGWFPEELPTRVERVEMGHEQYRQYLFAREKDEAEGKTGDGAGGQGAAVLATPALALPGSEKKAMRSYFVRSRTLSTFCPPREWRGADVAAMPDEAFDAASAPKLALVAGRVDRAAGPVLVYSQFIESGLRPLGRFLQRLGYAPYHPAVAAPPPKGYYATISGEVAGEDRAAIQAAFNAAANAHGAVIKAILVSKTGAEGLDLKWLRETHQLEPYWDKARDHQVTARAVRIGSHDGLPHAEREVQPYLYIAAPNPEIYQQILERDREPKTIDEIFFERANERFRINTAFRELLTRVCYECELYGYGSCRSCAPTNAPLYRDDPHLDLRLPDPCEVRSETEVEAAPLEVGGVTYYYRADPAEPIGYTFYIYREELGGFAAIEPSDPVIASLLAALA